MIATTRTYKLAAVLLALVFGVLLVQGVGATQNGSSKQSAEKLAQNMSQTCTELGGTSTTHYNMKADGSIDSIEVSCMGAGDPAKTCTFTQGATMTSIVCTLVPGEQSSGPNAPIGDGSLENIEVTPGPTHGDLGGGTLDPTDAGSSRPAVRSGTVATTVQADDEDRP